MDKSLALGIVIGASVSGSVGSAFKTLDQKFNELSIKSQKLKIGQTLAGDVVKYGETLKALREKKEALGYATPRLAKGIETVERKLREAKREAKAYGLSLKDIEREAVHLGAALKKTEAQIGAIQIRMRNRAVRSELKGQILGAVGGVFAASAIIKPSIDFESALADVKKVVDFASEEEARAFGRLLLEKSKMMPLAAEGLAAIAASGGQLGIAKEKLGDFTDVVARMSTAFDMLPDEAGDSIAKLMNVYGLGVEEVTRLGDAINQLGNTSAARERDIVNVLGRVGGTAKMFGLAGKEAASLSAAFLSLGRPPEIAGTAINAMLLKLKTADKQGKDFEEALGRMGLSAGGLKDAIEKDAQGALVGFLETISKIDKGEQLGILSDMFGTMYADDIALLVGGLDQYRQALKEAGNEARFAGAMQKEFESRSRTTANQIQLLKNSVTGIAINIGNALLPALNSVIGAIRPVAEGIGALAGRFPLATKLIFGAAIGLAALKVAALGGRFALTFLSDGMAGLRMVLINLHPKVIALNLSLLKTRAIGLGSAVAGWGKALASLAGTAMPRVVMGIRAITAAMAANPIGAALVALSIGATLVIMNWGRIKGFFAGIARWFKGLSLFEAGKKVVGSLLEGIRSMINKPVEAIKGMVGRMRAFLPFSPAKEGPFRDLHKVRIIETIAEGIRPASAVSAMAKTMRSVRTEIRPVTQPVRQVFAGEAPAPSRLSGQPHPAKRGQAPVHTAATVNYNPTITINGTSPAAREDFAKMLKDHSGVIKRMLEEFGRREARTVYA